MTVRTTSLSLGSISFCCLGNNILLVLHGRWWFGKALEKNNQIKIAQHDDLSVCKLCRVIKWANVKVAHHVDKLE